MIVRNKKVENETQAGQVGCGVTLKSKCDS